MTSSEFFFEIHWWIIGTAVISALVYELYEYFRLRLGREEGETPPPFHRVILRGLTIWFLCEIAFLLMLLVLLAQEFVRYMTELYRARWEQEMAPETTGAISATRGFIRTYVKM